MRNIPYVIIFLIIFSCSGQNEPKTFRSDNHKIIQAIDCYNSFKMPDNWKGNSEFKDSVLVVRNPEQGLYHDSGRLLVDKRPILTIDENSGHALSAQMILSDSRGNIYVFYQKNNSNYSIIKKYDPAGRLLADLNEENDLEEISSWSFWDIDEKDNLFVCEYGYSGYPFLRFNKRGSLTAKELIPFRKNFLRGFFLRNNNVYLLTDFNIRDNSVIIISKVSKYLESTRELYRKICKPLIKVPIFSNSLTPFYKPYSKLKNKWAVDSEGLLYIADTSQYQVSVYNQNGELVKIIDRPDYKHLKVTDIDKQVYYDRFFGLPYGSGISDKIKRRIIKEYKFPVYKPGIKKMIIDNENRIWVLTYEINDQYFSGVDIFDRQGIFLQRVWMSLFPEFVRDDKIYCIFDDGYGDAVSKVYAFVKNVQ